MKIVKLLGKTAILLAAFSFMACDMKLDDEDSRLAVKGGGGGSAAGEESGTDASLPVIYVGLGGENTFNLTRVKVGDTEQTIKNSTLKPSAWNAISEFETVQVKKGSSVSFSFAQAEAGGGAWNTWALAVYDNAVVSDAKGNFIRGDNWLNKSVDAGFKAGLWSEGDATAGGTYSNEFTYETAGKALTASDKVVVKVEYTDTGIKIAETVNGKLAYTAEGAFTSSTTAPSTDNTSQSENSIPTETDYVVGTADYTTSWVPGKNYTIAKGETQTVYFKNYGSGENNWNNFLIEMFNADSAVCGVTLRADNYGWNYGDSASREFSYDNVVTTGTSLPSDWAAWLKSINGATVKLEVSYKDGTITFKAASADVADWVQVYSFSGCESESLTWHLNVDGSYLVVLK